MKSNSDNLATQKSFLLILLAVVGINLVYYIYYILQFPHFIFDDYYIFYRIKNTPDTIFSKNPQEKFFLFLRPVTYLYYFITYHITHGNSVAIKILNLMVHICSTTIVLFTIKEYLELFRIRISRIMYLMFGMIISLNLDVFISLLWISNANELLSGLFYSLIFYVIALFLNQKIRSSTLFGLILSVLVSISLLVKQNSAHLPILILILFLLFKDKIEPAKRKTLLTTILVMFVIVGVFILLNTVLYYQSHIIIGFENTYKKPFAIIGTMLISYFPFPGKNIYSYFILHKLFAGMLLFVMLGMMLWAVKVKKGNMNIRNLIVYMFITILIYFPRILAQSGERLNIIQVLFLTSLFLFLFNYKRTFILIVFGLSVFSNIIESQSELTTIQNGYNYTRKADLSLREMRKNETKEKIYILWRNVWTTTPYSYYFNTHNEFGNDTSIILSEIAAFDINSWLDYARDVKIMYAHPNYRLLSDNNHTYFNITNQTSAEIINKKVNDTRGYSEILYKPNDIDYENMSYMYFNDSVWVKLE